MNSDKKVAVYDNQIKAREYMGFIAESAGCFCCAGRDGKVYFKHFGESSETIPLKLFKTYEFGEDYKISRVAFEDGIRSFKFGDETRNTLWINQENIFIVDEDQINKIYKEVKDFTINSFEGSVIINPALDYGDLIIVDGNSIIYQGELSFNGRFIADIKSKINIKQKQETTVKKESQKVINRRVQSEINQIDGRITQVVEETTETSEKITKVEQDINGIKQTATELNTKIDNIGSTETSSGQSIHIADGSKNYSILKIRSGNSVQKQTAHGKNYFNINDENVFRYGSGNNTTTKNDDGTITTTSNFSSTRSKGTQLLLEKNKDYTISLFLESIETESTSTRGVIEIGGYDESGKWVTQIKQGSITTQNYRHFMTFNSGDYEKWAVHISGWYGTGKNGTMTYRDVQVEIGTVATDYEEFIPDSPSIDFSSEIGNCGDNVNIFDKDNASAIVNYKANSIILKNGIRVTSIVEGNAAFCVYKIIDVTGYEEETFALKCNWTSSSQNDGQIFLGLCDEEGNNRITGPVNAISGKTVYYTIPKTLGNSKYLAMWLYSTVNVQAKIGDYIDYTDIKIAQREIEGYSAFNCGCIDINVRNSNILGKGFSTDKEDKNYWFGTTSAKFVNLADGWGRFEIDNTKGGVATYANAWISSKLFQKIIKANTKYKLIVEFRNLQIDNDDNSSYFCAVGNNTAEMFGQDVKYYRGGMLQLKQSAILTSRTQEELNSKTMLLRSFLCAVAGRKVSVECRICLSENLDIEEYKTGESQQITFPLTQNQKLYLEDYLEADGIHHKKKQATLNGTENWIRNTVSADTQIKTISFFIVMSNIQNTDNSTKGYLCSHFKSFTTANIYNLDEEGMWVHNNNFYIRINRERLETEDVEGLKKFLDSNNMNLEYVLVNEEIEEYTEEQKKVYKQLQNLMLYENDNYIECIDEIKPSEMELIYYPNTPYNNSLATKHDLDKTNNDTLERMQEINEELSSSINLTAHDVTTNVSSSVTSAILTLLNNGYLTAEQVNALVERKYRRNCNNKEESRTNCYRRRCKNSNFKSNRRWSFLFKEYIIHNKQ